MAKTHEQETNTVPLTVGNPAAAASLAIDQSHMEEFANTEEKSSIVGCRRGGAAAPAGRRAVRRRSAKEQTATGEQATQGAQRLRARRPLTDDEFDEHFDQLVDWVVRAGVSGEHFAVVTLWWPAARHAYETGDLEPLAKLLRSGAPLPPQVPLMLADVFDSCKLMRKRRGGQRKLFGMSAAARYASAAHDVRRLVCGELKLFGELSAKEVRTGIAGNPKARLEMDSKTAQALDASARKLSKLRDSKGRMSRKDAIEQIAAINGLEVDKLTDWMDGKTGASRRRK